MPTLLKKPSKPANENKCLFCFSRHSITDVPNLNKFMHLFIFLYSNNSFSKAMTRFRWCTKLPWCLQNGSFN